MFREFSSTIYTPLYYNDNFINASVVLFRSIGILDRQLLNSNSILLFLIERGYRLRLGMIIMFLLFGDRFS